ncbi:MAG TPA: PPC domain-containing protein [Kofleriaceae bacterium]|nr:PPC domain-containing protein [Kofleriaceae bacterium]
MLAALLAAPLGGCSLVLDFSPLPDAAPTDAPVTDAQCAAFEPNDDPSTPTDIQPGQLMAAICAAGESDYFRITVEADQTISVKIEFDNRGGAGDLDLRLLSGDGAMAYDDSKTATDTEEVMCPGGTRCPQSSLPAGMYLVQVVGATRTVQGPYTLTYTQTGP